MVIGTPTVLNLIPGGVMKVIHVNQVNENIEIQFRIMNGAQPFNVPEGVSCTIRGTKGDNFGYAADVAVTAGSNIVTVTLTEQLTAVAGAGNIFELVFVGASDDMKVSTENFLLDVERAALGEDTVISDSDLAYADQVLDQLQSVGAVNAQVQQNKANIAAEITRATAAEQTLQQNINAEAAARQAADNTLQSNINAEASSRATTDASLQSQINQLVAPSGSAPSAAEVENARIGSDGTVYPTLGDAIRTQNSLLKSQIEVTTNFDPIARKNNNKKYILISNKSIGNGGVTESITYPIAVSPGQVYKIHGYAGRGTTAEFAFANGETITYVYPETAVSTAHDSIQTVTVPDGVDTLYVSSYSTNGYSTIELMVDNADTKILYDSKLFDAELFEVGTFDPITGNNTTNSQRARTKGYIDDEIAKIIPSSLGVLLFAYNASDDSYAGYAQGLTVYASGVITSDPVYSTNEIDLWNIKNRSQYKFKLVIDKGNITSADASQTLTYQHTVQTEIKAVWKSIENINDDIESELYLTADDTISTVPTAEDMWGLYDALVTANPNYVYKNTLTQGTLTNYEYVFDSHAYNYQSASRPKFAATAKPEILITTGVHGNEPVAVMAAYGFFKALCEDKKAVSKLRQSFVFRIIPVAVPWGFTHRKRWNENGVNINRNFDAGWVAPSESAEPYTNNYQGTSAASELETQLLQAWLQAHTDAAIYIDYHNSGYNSEVSYLSLSQNLTDFTTLQNGFRYGMNQVIGYWRNIREMVADTLIYAYTGFINLTGNSERYGNQVGIQSMTLETSDDQNASGTNSNYTIGVGIEAFAAMIHGFADHHFKV